MDVDQSWFSTEACNRFQQMHADIFRIEAQAKALGMLEVKQALYRARIELGASEAVARREHAEHVSAGVTVLGGETFPPKTPTGGKATP